MRLPPRVRKGKNGLTNLRWAGGGRKSGEGRWGWEGRAPIQVHCEFFLSCLPGGMTITSWRVISP